MTIAHNNEPSAFVPEWDVADRMTKALRSSGVGVQEIAESMGVSRTTVGRWLNGRGEPKRAALIAWASLTGVSLDWLETGEAAPEGTASDDLRACRDSNPKPSGLESARARWGVAELVA